ncbi:MAG: prepilin-type N-terminal cleavage/methylation domain-containing protein [Elusimicrobiaceae bacterium]|nr:prepilin-type N-terminal cleavage/methylation domain-containing protein [Elusimicrobiaceae bacterium]
MKGKGFTLIELLAVIMIISVLTAIGVPQYRRSLERSRVAEALQMLPAIFDSRERLMVERGLTWSSSPASNENMSFSRLDVSAKGHIENRIFWVTNNFRYKLFITSKNGETHRSVGALLRRGASAVAGTVFFYDGSELLCCNRTNPQACDFFNIPAASKCDSSNFDNFNDPIAVEGH